MKGQQIFSSLLPGVTVAVLTTQPAWANTVKVNGVKLFAYSSALTSTNDRILDALNINTQLAPAVSNSLSAPVPAVGVMAASLKSLSSSSVGVVLTGKTGVPVRKVIDKVQGVLMSFKPTSEQTQLINKIRSATSTQKHNNPIIATVESKNTIVSNTSLKPASSVQQTMPPSREPAQEKKNSDSGLPKVSETRISRTVEVAKVLEQMELCLQQSEKGKAKVGRSASLLLRSSICSQQNATTNQVAQAGSSTPTPITPGSATPESAAPVPTPSYLNANPNPLQFPTRAEEVRLQGTQPITLAQALEVARGNNVDLQQALLAVERDRASVRQAQAQLLPNASIESSLTRSGPGFIEQPQQPQSASPPFSTTTFRPSATLNYNIYTSGRRSATIRQAEEQLRSTELDVERISEVIRLDVTTQYYDLQQADADVRINQSAVTNAQASLRDAQALEKAGVSTRFDVLRAQVNLANFQQQLTNALSAQQINRRRLAQTLNLPQSINVTTADPVRVAGLWNIPLPETIVRAFQNRPELQQQLAQRNIAEQTRRLQLAELGPQVGLVASYNLSDTFDDGTDITDNYSLGVTASLRLFDGGQARAAADVARANIRIAEVGFTRQRNQVRFEVEQAYSQLQSNLDNVQTARAAVAQSDEALRLARLRFQAGVGTQTEVIDAENDLTRSQGQEVQAILNYNRALASLQRAITSRSSTVNR